MTSIPTARKILCPLTLVLLMLTFQQCKEEESTVPAGQGWTSEDPVSIPLRQRLMQAERGNLVRNPSFEFGRLIDLDSTTVSYNITGWQEMGEGVAWEEHSPDTNGKTGQVHSGFHAIRIYRGHADKITGQGEGIQSDFIRVIPGHYDFSFWIRLRDIRPDQRIMGRNMGDAVDIRLLFFDKNRLPIPGNTYSHLRQAFIDQSFKALPFASFWEIDSLEWTFVKGRTTYDFLTEGYIPDEAKFVKLYLGLKGTGTMWVDDMDFRYTRKNFTSLERIGHMFDTTCTRLELVVPRPKQARSLPPVTYHVPGVDSIPLPLILIPPDARQATRAAAGLLKDRLEAVFARHYGENDLPSIRILSRTGTGAAGGGGLVFSIGNLSREGTSPEMDELGEEGYIIRPDSLNPNLVHLSAATPAGQFYAAATVVQLLDDTLFMYHQADILDYPDITGRAFLVSPVAAASNPIDYEPYLSDMAALKFNWAYLDFYRSRTLWKQESRAYLAGLEAIGRENRETGVLNLAQMVNPYAFLQERTPVDSLDEESRNRWIHSGSASRSVLYRQFAAGMNAGASTLVLCTNDYLPLSPEGDYVLYAERDREKYINLQDAHLEVIRDLHARARSRNPGISLEFLPPWYSNQAMDLSRGRAEQYFRDLGSKLPPDLRIWWSGPTRQSTSVGPLDYIRFHNPAGRDLILLDNSFNILPDILEDTAGLEDQPMKLRILNIFDPYSVGLSVPSSLPGTPDKILVNASCSSEIMKIRMATAADYMWNRAGYNPDLSLWKVLVSRFGLATTRELYHFNDAYFTTLASMIGLKKGNDQQKHARLIGEQMLRMEESLGKLDMLLVSDPELLNELKSLKQRLESFYEREIRTVASQILATTERF